MVDYRPFRNADPPAIREIWRTAGLGRGAATGIGNDAFDFCNYSQPYFDRAGLILACDPSDGRVVGFVHAGFAASDDGSALDRSRGVVCAVVVRPSDRRRGIGRELLHRAEAYLRDRGAIEILAGPARDADPFFFGLYGGTRPSGFLESDPLASVFLTHCGYEPSARHGVYHRNLTAGRDPANYRIVSIRRKSELGFADVPPHADWWWFTHIGRLDSINFLLLPRGGGEPTAQLTAVGLDVYLNTWNERAVGLCDLHVRDDLQGKGYGQTLVIEVLRRLRQELVQTVEIHSDESHKSVLSVINATGFERVDTGVVYRKTREG